MKNFLIILLLIVLSACNHRKNNSVKEISVFGRFPLEVPEQNSLMARWENKAVLGTLLIDDMENDSGWKATGIGEISYTEDRSKDGKKSLRFRTSLRDEEHYRKNRSDWDSFNGGQGGTSSVLLEFKTPRDWSAFNRISFWVYVHPTTQLTYCLFLEFDNEGTDYNATYPGGDHFIQDLKPGVWNHVLFEIPHLERNKVTRLEINQMLIGHHPEDEGIVTYDIDNFELQKVETDQFEGWTVAPGKFSFSHIGYRPEDPKIAMSGSISGDKFDLTDQNGDVVYSGDVKHIETLNGAFDQLDFTVFRTPGIYRIRQGAIESDPFPIGENIWLQPVFKAINFFFCERCGYNVPGIHTECHKDWQGFRGDDKKIINGGWHDAGDLSQGSWRTSMAVFAMIDNLGYLGEQKEAGELAARLRSEIEWGLGYLLKTRFGDGYHMSFSVMRIYTDNKTGTIDDVVSPAKNVPWENFLTAAVQCKAAMLFEKTDPELALKARVAAIEDWQAAVNSRQVWNQADYREASWGVTSSLLLGQMTGDDKYKEQAVLFGDLLIRCQEQSFHDGNPITGYFYEDTERQKVIHNYHAAFEEAPLIALSMLCRSFPDDNNWMSWYSAAVLHSEFFMKRGSRIAAPYYHLPNSVWQESEIMAEKDPKIREDMLRQYKDGTRLSNEYVLRTFPIYRDGLFHGNTNIQMSGTWALAEASRLRNDTAGMKLVGKQLQWVMGNNPFGQSLMYGAGYNFAPHFAYCLKDVVGSLPVGMDCMSGDMPHWSATNTATSKEIWVEPVNRFLGAVSVYSNYSKLISTPQVSGEQLEIQTAAVQTDDGVISVTLTLNGSGKHEIEIKTHNAETGFTIKQVDLKVGTPEIIQLKLNITDRLKPYIALISTDKNPVLNKEIVGSFVSATF